MEEKERQVQVCKCENCGNEAEMTVVCEWVPAPAAAAAQPKAGGRRQKKSFTCVNCGNEADLTVDL